MAASIDDFKKSMQYWGSGVSVVTTASEKFGLQGMTVTAFSSVSVNPPQILVCINETADTGAGIQLSERFTVNVLNANQQEVSNYFAGGASQSERFAITPWQPGSNGCPVLTESLMSLECHLVEQFHCGTHWVMIGEVQHCVCREGEPLLYYKGNYRLLAD